MQGAGFPDVDGRYRESGDSDGVPYYTQLKPPGDPAGVVVSRDLVGAIAKKKLRFMVGTKFVERFVSVASVRREKESHAALLRLRSTSGAGWSTGGDAEGVRRCFPSHSAQHESPYYTLCFFLSAVLFFLLR